MSNWQRNVTFLQYLCFQMMFSYKTLLLSCWTHRNYLQFYGGVVWRQMRILHFCQKTEETVGILREKPTAHVYGGSKQTYRKLKILYLWDFAPKRLASVFGSSNFSNIYWAVFKNWCFSEEHFAWQLFIL